MLVGPGQVPIGPMRSDGLRYGVRGAQFLRRTLFRFVPYVENVNRFLTMVDNVMKLFLNMYKAF